MYKNGDVVELKGTLTDLSTRVWARGWSFGKIRAQNRVEYRITGILEGHVEGTQVTVRGVWKDDPKRGGGIALDSIMVESLSGDSFSVEAWFQKHLPEHEEVGEHVIREVLTADRWDVLADAEALVDLGCSAVEALEVAKAVSTYLASIASKKFLLSIGFTEQEANRIMARYKTGADMVLAVDPYELVHDEVVAFHRVDVVAMGYYGTTAMDETRICGALSAALLEAARNGHTGLGVHEVCVSAAEYAGVYPDTIKEALPRCLKYFVQYDGILQTRRLARDERAVARSIAALVRRNAEE